jgi:hypothetical protein
MSNDVNFNDQMFLNSEAVYAQIEQGQYESPAQVEAALMTAQLDASQNQSH